MDNITYESISRRARERLDCGADRIADTPTDLRWSWWPSTSKPDFQDELLSGYGVSDYGVDTRFSTLAKEFSEEVGAIRETLDELGNKPDLAEWQKTTFEPARKMMVSLNQAASAHSVWDQIGVPIRRRGDMVFRIWSPRDVMGSPIIKALPVDVFINGIADHTASNRIEIERLRKNMEKWQAVAIILAVVIALRIAVWLL